MKKTFTLFIAFIPIFLNAQNNKIKYLDIEGKEVDKELFYKTQISKGCTVGQNDEGTIYRLIADREKKGKINDYKELINLINSKLGQNLSSNQPLFVYYYPGPDITNNSTSSSEEANLDFKSSTDKFQHKLQKEINAQTLFVYKKASGKVYENHPIIPWKKDPNGEFEKRFFPDYHYWYASFVIIFPNGDYNTYLGEFSYDQVFEYIKKWKKNNKIK